KIPLAGGAETLIGATGGRIPPTPIAIDATNVYYYDTSSGNHLAKMPKSGGMATFLAPLASNQLGLYDWSLDSTAVYFVDGENAVVSAPIAGGTTTTLATTSGAWAGAADATNV